MVLVAAAILVWNLNRDRGAVPDFLRTPDQNILLITIDTLRGDVLGSYGGRAATPNLDRLAAGGLRFTFAHAHAVVTLPSHASILTGRYPFDHGVRDNSGFRLGAAPRTLAEAAREKGMATGAFVGAFPLDRRFGLSRGFDVYDDVGGEAAQADFAFTERRAGEVVAVARAWIDRQQKPWLAWVHVFDPHASYSPPPPFDRKYASDPYAGEVAYVDQALGPLLEVARAGPRPTTVIVTADHGEGLGDHGEATHGTFAYESTLRVPLILAQVGAGRSIAAAPGGATIETPVRHVDILPTIGDLAGLSLPRDLPGRSLLSATASAVPSYFEAMTPMHTRGWAPLSGVVVGRDKYIDLPIEELYDLGKDPHEASNLALTSRDVLQTLARELGSLGPALPGARQAEDREARQRLESLGYVSGSAPRKAKFTEADDPKRLIELDRLMLQGIDLFERGRHAEAIDTFRQVISRRPDMALAYRRLAYIQRETGAVAAAIATLREGLQRTGPNVDLEVRLGTCLVETGALSEATPMLERAIHADPENTEALNALGIAHARAGRPDDALLVFERILGIDSRNAQALENIGTVQLQRGNMEAAAAAFGRAAAANPRSSRAHAGSGVVAFKQGRLEEALSEWRRAVDLDPRNFDALYNLATELARAGRVQEARPYLERFARTAPPALYARDIAQVNRLLSRYNR